ncbi:unnamed protein product [Effrenium voratum]|uniref:Glycosyl hydrolase family 13 catalytic domain-containing protein n=1 Tax=Effrenium voratum TaxID=2562239 RepID=A0AA36NF16_9DINO|nr:unnamed protein product [Effrenium voratum]
MGQSGGKMPGNLQLAKGEPRPKGCCESPKGGEVNFTIDAPGRGSVWLYLLLPEGHEGASTLEGVDSSGGELYVQLDPSTNKTGDTWHVKLTLPGGFDPKGAKYMWILDPKLDQHGLPEANAVRILDPCAKCLDSRYAKDWNKRGGPKFSPMAVVPDRRAIYEFDWQGVKPPNLHLKDLVIYEAHVRGFTRNPDSKLQDWDATAGTFLGFIQKIPHLLKLGINAVELLPVYEFDETACPRKNPENGEQLCNFWGYSTVNFFVPMQRFSSRDRIGAAIVGFKTLVRELHRQGIEVILDVVFNHTAEGAWGEHFWHSWAAIAKNRYYILSNGQDTNYTGCGNTVNANDPMCSDWIVECLSYWVDEMHVDGFRFDLASALTRGNDGKVSMDPLLIKKMANEPKLKRAKFIAEAWDCSWPDGYLVGKFPSGGPPRWAEWNGIFRDTIRCFIKGDEGKKGDFATRICGSSDLFKHNGRKPFHSINFITAHDGFTLKDLVSYNGKHNTCNGENSGDDHNNSWNCGHEGDTGDGGVNHLRSRQIRNFMVALFMSAGTPMILYGDEYGRSQRGCNNGWCQDARCWFSWSDSEKQESLMSGAFMDAIEEGESLETKKEEAFQPPPRKPSREQVQKKPSKLPLPAKPATGGEGAKVIDTDLGDKRVEAILYPDGAEGRVLEVRAKGFGGGELIFHWGLIESFGAGWSNAPEQVCNASWPDKTKTFPGANQTVFSDAEDDGFRRVMIPFPRNVKVKAVNFVLHQPPKGWHKPGHQDFTAEWPQAESLFSAAADRATEAESGKSVRTTRWKVRGGNLMGVGAVWAEGALVHFVTDLDTELMLHYGPGDAYNKWVFARSENFRSAPEDGVKEIVVKLKPEEVTKKFMFVLKFPGNTWVKDGADDFKLWLPEDESLVQARLSKEAEKEAKAQAKKEEVKQKAQKMASNFDQQLQQFRQSRPERKQSGKIHFQSITLSEQAGDVDVACRRAGDGFVVQITGFLHPDKAGSSALLHWGVLNDFRDRHWHCPPEECLPDGSKIMDAKACQTPFELDDGILRLDISLPTSTMSDGACVPAIPGMAFVIRVPEKDKWLKCEDGKDCVAFFRDPPAKQGWKGGWQEQVNFIIESETKWGHMTLMHRYNNCRDMIQTWSSRSNTGEAAMRRMPSWSATFNKDALRRASWSRLPSASLLIDPEEEKSEEQDDELWSWIFVWQRFSFMRLLDWQRNYNTKPRELAGATDSLANKICSVWKEYPNIRLWARWTLATIGRGGNQGQAIRDEILHIMHRNKIPETKGHFYEEWHQKLHNNTTPDDVGICKALLAFLRTGGKMEEYWKVLHDHGITKERLASYERSITKEPYMHGDAGRLIMEFENYLRILQSVHDALDLKTAIDAAKSCLPKQVMDQLQEISGSDAKMKRSRSLGSLDKDSQEKSHQRFMKLAEARLGILGILNDSKTDVGVIRQLLLLDYSLETQQSVIAQGNTDETRLPTLCEQMKAFLTSVVGHIPLHGELRALLVDWTQLAPECANLKFGAGPAESALMLKALCDRLARVVGEQVDTFQTLLAPKATTLGQAVGVEKNVLEVFVDEVLRGSALFALSLILKRLEPQLRSIAQLPPWQMISAVDHPVQGELVSVPRMLHMQDKIFETPTIMLSGLVSGEEEVPVGVQAVLVRDAKSAPDILSHCAVRARNSGVLLASCYDSTLTEKIEAELLGQWVQVVCSADGSVEIKAAERPMADPKRMRMMARSASRDLTQELMSKETDSTKLVNMNLKEDFGCKWVVTPEKMDKSKVGSKSLNLALLKPQLPKDILTPQAVAMPYGSMQKALTSRENAKEWLSKLEACLAQLQPTSSNEDAKTIFQEAQVYVNALQMPSELDQALRSAMEEVGSKEGEKRLLNLYHRGDAWDATKQVWASLFGLRPWVSLAKAGRSFYDLNMAVLVQELLPAKYAFVLHTKNPFTNDPNEVYGEVVPGRGETLVGNYPGRALSFRARKGETPVVTSFLSKSTLLRTQECLIFRSDSNGEDLEGFAGAGLFESICATSDIPCMVRFHRLRLLTDHSFRQTLLSKLAEAGRAVEKAFGSPQDIEGCVDPQDRIFIVQSRPQV